MATNQVVFDQVYAIIKAVRGELRDAYDDGRISQIDERVFFTLDHTGNNVYRSVDSGGACCTVSWDNNNANLRSLARDVMNELCD